MPSFNGNDQLILQPLDRNVYIEFLFTTETENGNDGFLPFGTNIGSIESMTCKKVANETGRTITPITDTQLVESYTFDPVTNIVTIKFDYPTTNGNGYYNLRMELLLNNNTKLEADFNRILCKDR